MAKQKTRRERRAYNDEYKQKVLELISVGDKSASQICPDPDLDLTPSAVHKWIKVDKANSGIMTQNCLCETDQQELMRLPLENKRLLTAEKGGPPRLEGCQNIRLTLHIKTNRHILQSPCE